MSFTRHNAYSRAPAAANNSARGHEANEEQAANGKQETDERKSETELREMQRQTGFTMFRPDPKKKAQMEQVARREMEEADARHEARRLRHCNEAPRSVGGATSYAAVIQEKQRAATSAGTGLQIQKKREKWQRAKREAEEKEYRERKEKARSQAERNEILAVVRAKEREETHREAQRRKNQEFLDRLEKDSKYK